MAPKASVPKSDKALDKIKIGSILDVQGFLSRFNHSEEVKKVIKAFTDCTNLIFPSFGYSFVNKEEVLELVLRTIMLLFYCGQKGSGD